MSKKGKIRGFLTFLMVLAALIFVSKTKTQTIDTANWSISLGSDGGGYNTLVNRNTYYGQSAGTIRVPIVFTGEIDQNVWQFTRGIDGEMNLVTNKISKYGFAAGQIFGVYIVDGSSSLDTSIFALTYGVDGRLYVTNRSTYQGISSGVLRIPFLYNANSFTDRISVQALDLSTGYPVVPYENFAGKFLTPQYAKKSHQDILATQYTYLDLYFQLNYTSGTYIIAQQEAFTTAFQIKIESNIIKWVSRGTTRILDTITVAGWHSYRLFFDDSTAYFYTDGILNTSYSSVTIDTCTQSTTRALVIGDDYQLYAQGLSNVITEGSTANWQIDSLYMYCGVSSTDHDTLLDINFDNGALMLSGRQWDRWANQDAHDFVFYNLAGGYTNMAYNYYHPTQLNRDGYDRKDTAKTISMNGGFTLQVSNEHARATVNFIVTAPNGTNAVAGGIFNRANNDTTTDIGNNLALWNGSAWVEINSGFSSSRFPYDAVWTTNRYVSVSWVEGSDRGITTIDVIADTAKDKVVDTVAVDLTMGNSKVYLLDRSRLMEYNYVTNAYTVKKVFRESVTPLSVNSAVLFQNDTFIVAAGDSVYVLNSSFAILEQHYCNPYTTSGKYSRGGIWRIKRDSYGRTWLVGDYKGLDNDTVPRGYGAIGYIKNGVYRLAGRISGGKGDCDAYAPSCLEGAFTCMVTNVCEPNSGELVFTGTNRLVNDNYTGNFFKWTVNGFEAMNTGSAWTMWMVDTIRNNGYVDLAFATDCIEHEGVKVNCAGIHYLDEHFLALNPTLSYTPLTSTMNPANYPPTITASIYSKARRSLTNEIHFKIGVNDDTTSIAFTQTDSSLTNSNGYWTKNHTVTLTGSVSAGDTLFTWIESTDNLGNDTISSVTTTVMVNPALEIPTDFVVFYRKDTLSSSPVTTWQTRNGTSHLAQSTTVLKPTFNALTGLTFDSSSLTVTPMVLSSPTHDSGAVFLVMKATDTNLATTGNIQAVWHYRISTSDLIVALNIGNEAASSTKKFGISFYNGTGSVTNRCFVFPTAQLFNKYALIVINYDSVNAQTVWVNGTQLTSPSASFQNIPSGGYMGVGLNESNVNRFKGSIEYAGAYIRNLTAAEIAAMQTSAVNAGLIR